MRVEVRGIHRDGRSLQASRTHLSGHFQPRGAYASGSGTLQRHKQLMMPDFPVQQQAPRSMLKIESLLSESTVTSPQSTSLPPVYLYLSEDGLRISEEQFERLRIEDVTEDENSEYVVTSLQI